MRDRKTQCVQETHALRLSRKRQTQLRDRRTQCTQEIHALRLSRKRQTQLRAISRKRQTQLRDLWTQCAQETHALRLSRKRLTQLRAISRKRQTQLRDRKTQCAQFAQVTHAIAWTCVFRARDFCLLRGNPTCVAHPDLPKKMYFRTFLALTVKKLKQLSNIQSAFKKFKTL